MRCRALRRTPRHPQTAARLTTRRHALTSPHNECRQRALAEAAAATGLAPAAPHGEILRGLIAAAGSAPEPLSELRNSAVVSAHEAAWLTMLNRTVARGDAPPGALLPRVADTPMALLRNEYVMLGVPTVPDAVLVEIVDEIFLPLVHGYGPRQ
ncbi:TetR-like C-terminal domain-containing protein [Streptomyces sp. NPDC127168]|uniref:TetR-like C-terminal domain-containing protein n=1 Tax=unclassified Streptomyces TaxID=2593676 RepID=UPI0036305702